jgi:hypothetical protein
VVAAVAEGVVVVSMIAVNIAAGVPEKSVVAATAHIVPVLAREETSSGLKGYHLTLVV